MRMRIPSITNKLSVKLGSVYIVLLKSFLPDQYGKLLALNHLKSNLLSVLQTHAKCSACSMNNIHH